MVLFLLIEKYNEYCYEKSKTLPISLLLLSQLSVTINY